MKIEKISEKVEKFLMDENTRLVQNDGEHVFWQVGQDRFAVGVYAVAYPEGYFANFGDGLLRKEPDANSPDYKFRIGYNSKGKIFFARENGTAETAFLAAHYFDKKTKIESSDYFFAFVCFSDYCELICTHGKYGAQHVFRLASHKNRKILMQEVAMLLPTFDIELADKFQKFLKGGAVYEQNQRSNP